MTRRPPVFLIGPARSGTTLLYKALCLHPRAAFISNWVRRFPDHPQLALVNRLPRWTPNLERRSWFGEDSNAYTEGRRRSWPTRLMPTPVEGEPLFRRCGVPENGIASSASAGQRKALRRALGAVQRYGGGDVLICKRIANNRRIPFLVDVFPDARFVVLIRDGRAVAYSLSRVNWWEESTPWWQGGSPREWQRSGRDPWELCARNWVEEIHAIEEGVAAVPAEQLYPLTYEQFVASPRERLARIADFSGLRRDAHWMRQLGQIDFPNMNDSWRSKLASDVRGQIERIQAEELSRYGYS